jgi:two-component system NarL family sensor kinase
VQEALTNVRKHSQACSVTISAIEQEGEAIFEVSDNGGGFSQDDAQPTSQYGLRSMRERAEAIDADFQIVSAPGTGTTIRLRIPINGNENL